MKKCIICGQDTEGSIGKAGIKWSCICQPCKDKEDNYLENKFKYEKKVVSLVDKS